MIRAEIPTKPYVKRHLQHVFGKDIVINRANPIGKHIFQLLKNPSSEFNTKFTEYSDTAIICIKESIFLRKGCFLTPHNIMEFNNFVAELLKQDVRLMLDTLVEYQGMKIVDAVEIVYEKFDQDEQSFPYETIKKDYYRHRKRLCA